MNYNEFFEKIKSGANPIKSPIEHIFFEKAGNNQFKASKRRSFFSLKNKFTKADYSPPYLDKQKFYETIYVAFGKEFGKENKLIYASPTYNPMGINDCILNITNRKDFNAMRREKLYLGHHLTVGPARFDNQADVTLHFTHYELKKSIGTKFDISREQKSCNFDLEDLEKSYDLTSLNRYEFFKNFKCYPHLTKNVHKIGMFLDEKTYGSKYIADTIFQYGMFKKSQTQGGYQGTQNDETTTTREQEGLSLFANLFLGLGDVDVIRGYYLTETDDYIFVIENNDDSVKVYSFTFDRIEELISELGEEIKRVQNVQEEGNKKIDIFLSKFFENNTLSYEKCEKIEDVFSKLIQVA